MCYIPLFLITISPMAVDPTTKTSVKHSDQKASIQHDVTIVTTLAFRKSTATEILNGNRKRKKRGSLVLLSFGFLAPLPLSFPDRQIC